MAAAEARAAWQRMANRCFVQEDAKIAPKLAYPLSKQADPDPENIPDWLENNNLGFDPLNINSSFSNLPPESRWWLQIQPNNVYQQSLSNKMEESKVQNASLKNDNIGFGMEESYEFLEMDSFDLSVSKKIDEPWWRVVDGDELASLVSQRSLEFIENCDLPRPENSSSKREMRGFYRNCHCVGILKSSDEKKVQKSVLSSPKVDIKDFASLESECDQGLFGSDKQSSDVTNHKGLTELLENDPTKAQLMDALRHSQTRAREAEEAAKQACAEKEQILKVFFKQASHLFAYKQWFQLLRLEKIYLHMKNTNQPLSSLFPVDFPFTSYIKRKIPNNRKKGKNRGKQDYGKFGIAFALGIAIVGAGLFLGWTFAWMLPNF